ncbi:expression site-associated gene (ESAG-like) protein [Trypanosoma cruzi marinkellei]|uniref:Expression site-associated gene (ESAG-like) protein n=1 Tax=Trypanosoma cruzi marinkellei TaxID=85056 RepID=K2NFH2_TRYCR|nr:expression site-associated gene (ESAG-like) protein [Trypanosoma cruzi marinkellei]
MSSFPLLHAAVFFLMMLILVTECSRTSSARRVLDPRKEMELLGPNGNLTVSVSEKFLNTATFLFIPLLNSLLRGLKIPSQEEGSLYLGQLNFTKFGVGAVLFAMDSPNVLNITLYNLQVAIPQTDFSVWVGFFWCNGILSFSVNMLSIRISLEFVAQSNGKLGVKSSKVNIFWLKLVVSHSFTNGFCSGMEAVVELFFGDLDNLIVEEAKQKLPDKIGSRLEEKLNALFNTFPFHVSESPSVSKGRLQIAMNPDAHSKKSEEMSSSLLPVISSPLMPSNLDLLHWRRDVEVYVTEPAFNEILLYLNRSYQLNHSIKLPACFNSSLVKSVFPNLYTLCPNCSFIALISPTVPPRAVFGPDRKVIFDVLNGFVGLRMVSSTGQEIPVLEILVNCTAGFKDLQLRLLKLIYFRLTAKNLTVKVLTTNIGTINENALNKAIRFLLRWVFIPYFNAAFIGFPLPPQISFPLLEVSTEGIKAGFDFTLL